MQSALLQNMLQWELLVLAITQLPAGTRGSTKQPKRIKTNQVLFIMDLIYGLTGERLRILVLIPLITPLL